MNRLENIFYTVLQVKTFSPQQEFVNDLGADSLDLIDMVMKIEDEFKIEIEDKDAEKIKTVQNVYDYFKDRKIEI